MDEKTIRILNKEMELHSKPGPGSKKYAYVSGKDVIVRLNEAFEHEWSSEVIEEKATSDHIVMRVRLSYKGTSHEGYGGAAIALYSQGPNTGKPVDLGNSYKSAYTSALKKAAEQFGIGLGMDEEDTPAASPGGSSQSTAHTQHRLEGTAEVSPEDAAKAMFAKLDINALSKAVQDEVDRMRSSGALPNQAGPVSGEAVIGHTPPVTAAPAPFIPRPSKPSYDPTTARKPDATNSFMPSNNGSEKINDIQANAINGLIRVKKVSFDQIVAKTLPGSNKTSMDQLTQDDAKVIIKALNTIKNG
jgi:hypothetical protein